MPISDRFSAPPRFPPGRGRRRHKAQGKARRGEPSSPSLQIRRLRPRFTRTRQNPPLGFTQFGFSGPKSVATPGPGTLGVDFGGLLLFFASFCLFLPPWARPWRRWSLQPPPIKHIFPLSNSLFLKFFFTPSAQSCSVQNSSFSPRFPITLNSIAFIPRFCLFSNGSTTFRTFLFFFFSFNPFLGAQSAASLIYYHRSGISLSPYLLGSEEQPHTLGRLPAPQGCRCPSVRLTPGPILLLPLLPLPSLFLKGFLKRISSIYPVFKPSPSQRTWIPHSLTREQ